MLMGLPASVAACSSAYSSRMATRLDPTPVVVRVFPTSRQPSVSAAVFPLWMRMPWNPGTLPTRGISLRYFGDHVKATG